MRWINPIKQKPQSNDSRIINKFAFLPVKAWSHKDGLRYTVWLEIYKVHQVYKQGVGFYGVWIDLSNYID